MGGAEMAGRGNGMKWRVMLELIGGDGTVSTYEIGGCALIAGRNGRLRMSVRRGWPRCLARWRFARRDFYPAGVR
jgi:hypothetical protein